MGSKVSNVEFVTDYTPGESFIRLHMDLPIPAPLVRRTRDLLDNGEFSAALDLVKSANPDLRNIEMLDAAWGEMRAVREPALKVVKTA